MNNPYECYVVEGSIQRTYKFQKEKDRYASHKQVPLHVVHGGREYKIWTDAGIASFIQELWNAGFPTYFSCEGHDADTQAYVMCAMPKGILKYNELIRRIRSHWPDCYVALTFNIINFALSFHMYTNKLAIDFKIEEVFKPWNQIKNPYYKRCKERPQDDPLA